LDRATRAALTRLGGDWVHGLLVGCTVAEPLHDEAEVALAEAEALGAGQEAWEAWRAGADEATRQFSNPPRKSPARTWGANPRDWMRTYGLPNDHVLELWDQLRANPWSKPAARDRAQSAPESLVTVDNYKTIKGEAYGYRTIGLNLYPSTGSVEWGGRNVCPMAGSCKRYCLSTTGRNAAQPNQVTRLYRTIWYLHDRAHFLRVLASQIASQIRTARSSSLRPVLRLNLLSDLPRLGYWARNTFRGRTIYRVYDYTKLWTWRGRYHSQSRYYLTFSLDSHNGALALEALDRGFNVAVPYAQRSRVKEPLPATWAGWPVLDGDETDLRFLDPPAGRGPGAACGCWQGNGTGLVPKGLGRRKGSHTPSPHIVGLRAKVKALRTIGEGQQAGFFALPVSNPARRRGNPCRR